MQDDGFWASTLKIWMDGGPLMVPLALLTLVIYYYVLSLYLDLSRRQFGRVDPNLWSHWVDKPSEGTGELGEIIRYVSDHDNSTARVRASLNDIRGDYLPRIDSRTRFAMILVSTAPLAGLLGTVMGMLKTFDGISASAGAGTTGLVAGGIAEALITTETGLVIAIPGYVLLSRVRAMREGLDLFLIRLENAFVRRMLPRPVIARS